MEARQDARIAYRVSMGVGQQRPTEPIPRGSKTLPRPGNQCAWVRQTATGVGQPRLTLLQLCGKALQELRASRIEPLSRQCDQALGARQTTSGRLEVCARLGQHTLDAADQQLRQLARVADQI